MLLPSSHPGLETGPRHNPVDSGFMNGTVRGTDVFVPLDQVVGGQGRVGFGWNMLMECLGEGRGISLPASAGAIAQLSVHAVGGYSRIRKQFKVPIAEMEGVQERLAVIASNAFTITSAQELFNAIVGNHERPPVLSAIMKLRCTELGRDAVSGLGMDEEAFDLLSLMLTFRSATSSAATGKRMSSAERDAKREQRLVQKSGGSAGRDIWTGVPSNFFAFGEYSLAQRSLAVAKPVPKLFAVGAASALQRRSAASASGGDALSAAAAADSASFAACRACFILSPAS